ncbi:MAG TPA: cupredoxin family copper-binding protein [Methanotrichaceae archaeon]|nr:cupredoxin family copper-binding protein [Methanotrichaceae archaeon]
MILTLASSPAQGRDASVEITSSAFNPGNAVVDAGSTVTWINNDTSNHTVIGDDGQFESGELAPGESFNLTFSSTGAYHYRCGTHPSMRGTVSVVPRKAAAGGSAHRTAVSGKPAYQSIIAPVRQADPVSAKLGLPFQIRVGQTASIENEGIEVKFINVTGDSRCPSDVACIWAGQATVLVDVIKEGRDMGIFNLTSTTSSGGLAAKSFDGYSVRLDKIEPYPKSSQKIELSDYVATLVVQKIEIAES